MQHVFTSIFCAVRSPEPNAKCAFWVKLYHKPRAACKAKWKVKNGRKYNNNNSIQFYIYTYISCIFLAVHKTQNQSKVKPARKPRYGHNANLWSEFNYVLIGTQLLRSCFLCPPTPLPLHAHSLCCCLWQPLPVHRYVRAEAAAAPAAPPAGQAGS